MYQVMYVIEGRKFVIQFATGEQANNFIKTLRNSNIKDVYVQKPKTAQKTTKEHFVVKVTFTAGGRQYTYLSNELIPVGSFVVVWTADGRMVVPVVDSGSMSETELEQICPLSKFKHIEGKVVAA